VIGEALALSSAFCFAFASVAIAKGAVQSSGESGVLLSVLLTGLLAGLGWLATGGAVPIAPGPAALPWAALGWFAASGLLATVLGRLSLFKSIEFAGVVRASTIRRLMPFLSLILAWVLLGDVISGLAGAGMGLIAGSFVLLWLENRKKLQGRRDPSQVSLGIALGALSALLYALSYVVRSIGLDTVPDPFFGALIGALAALGYYVAACMVSTRYRAMVRDTLRHPNPWQIMAALCMSVGQILQFMALTFTDVPTVTFINSVEVYIAAVLAVFVFRTEPMPSAALLAATALATLGVILVALG
jgi:drug/metabolite transporter (DMT)-like permease